MKKTIAIIVCIITTIITAFAAEDPAVSYRFRGTITDLSVSLLAMDKAGTDAFMAGKAATVVDPTEEQRQYTAAVRAQVAVSAQGVPLIMDCRICRDASNPGIPPEALLALDVHCQEQPEVKGTLLALYKAQLKDEHERQEELLEETDDTVSGLLQAGLRACIVLIRFPETGESILLEYRIEP